jgi:hypothetical protein
MREPLLDALISPGLAKLRSFRRSADPDAEKIVILQDVYPSLQVQRNIPQICRDLAAGAGVRLIAVEGPCGPVQLPPEASSPMDVFQRYPQLSGAAANALLLRLPEVVIEGVDDPRMHEESRQAQRYLEEHRGLCKEVFACVVEELSALQVRVYPPEITELRRSVVRLFGRRTGLTKQMSLVKSAAASLGIDLSQFPSFHAFDEALRLEREFDLESAERERTLLVQRFVHALFDSLEPDAAGRVPEERCAAVLRFWMRRSGIVDEEMQRNLQLRGLATVLEECRDALLGWVINTALEAREDQSAGAQRPILEAMLQLLDDLGLPKGELPDIELYMRYLTVTMKDIDPNALLRELPQWSQLLVEALPSPEARELRQLEDELDLVRLGVRMELSPELAESAPLDAGALRSLLARLAALGGSSLPGLAERLAGALSAASVFYTRSLARGGVMGRNTLAAMQRLRTDRAVLIAGGFHPRTITKSLEDERRVSWSILTPELRLDEEPSLIPGETDPG